MEYIVIIAIVLSIAIIVLGISGFFPSFTYSAQMGDSARYWSSAASPIAIIDFKQTADNFSAIIENRASANIQITGFALSTEDGTYTETGFSSLPPGGRSSVSFNTQSCSGRRMLMYDVQISYDTDHVSGLNQKGLKQLYVQCTD
ncbi:MAG: hypothetical protein ABIH83_00095 [Candidatus Micrarchaeota archaeon]